MKSNFEFLSDSFKELAKIGELAERYLFSDANTDDEPAMRRLVKRIVRERCNHG